jgi:hypothetical protein
MYDVGQPYIPKYDVTSTNIYDVDLCVGCKVKMLVEVK